MTPKEEVDAWYANLEPAVMRQGSMTVLGNPYLQHERFAYGYNADAREEAAKTSFSKPNIVTGILVADDGETWLTCAAQPSSLKSCYWRHI